MRAVRHVVDLFIKTASVGDINLRKPHVPRSRAAMIDPLERRVLMAGTSLASEINNTMEGLIAEEVAANRKPGIDYVQTDQTDLTQLLGQSTVFTNGP